MDWCRRLSLFACPHHPAHSLSDRPHELRRNADHWRRRGRAGGGRGRGLRRKSGRGRATPAVRPVEADGARRGDACCPARKACGATETCADSAGASASSGRPRGDPAGGGCLTGNRNSRHRNGECGNGGRRPGQRWRHRLGSGHRYGKREWPRYGRRTRTLVPANADSILPAPAARAGIIARLSPHRLLRRR